MALPNPSMSFSPFAILTAEEMNEIVENIESLSDGSGFEAGAIPTAAYEDDSVTEDKIDFTTFNIYTASGSVSTSTSTSPESAGVSVAATIGSSGKAIVHIKGGMYNSNNSIDTRLGFALSGANTLAASTDRCIQTSLSTGTVLGATFYLSGLTPGSTTFTLQKWVQANTGSYYANPTIIIQTSV